MSNKEKENFIELTLKLEAVEFVGLARILCVNVVDEDKNPIDFYLIMDKVVEKFCTLRRKQRREILSVLKQATKGK